MADYIIGIDIGGTNFRIGAITEDARILRHEIVSSRAYLTMEHPLEALCEQIARFIQETPGTPRGCCMGFPGTVSKDKSTVFSCPNFPVFDGVNIRQTLESKFGFPVIVEHEVLLLLTNDMQLYDLSHLDCVIGVYLGTGFGNAIYVHGRLLEGANGVSGELGHIPVVGADWVCPCGSVGCIEMISAGKRLEVIKNEHFPEESTFEGVLAHGASDPVIAEYIDNIACAIATEINILDPDRVVLGGGVINTPNFPYEALLDRIRFRARKPYPSQTLQFIHPEKDSLQGIRGAGLYGWKYLSV